MKSTSTIKSLAALAMLATAGFASADVGTRDGSDQFSDFRSSRTRAEVQDEIMNGGSQGAAESSRITSDEANTGAYGVAGSRYSSRPESKDVGGQATNSNGRPAWNPSYIYFGS